MGVLYPPASDIKTKMIEKSTTGRLTTTHLIYTCPIIACLPTACPIDNPKKFRELLPAYERGPLKLGVD